MRLLVSACLCTVVPAQGLYQTTRTAVLPVPPGPSGWMADLAVGDIDGDGDRDLLFAYDDGACQLLRNDGRGGFADVTATQLLTAPGGVPAVAADFADIDGDGDPDLLLAQDDGTAHRVFRNDGSGTFTDVSATAVPPSMNFGTDQIVADLDGDGDLDWVVLGTTRLYLNNGNGVFVDGTAGRLAFGGSGFESGSTAADFDGDGDLDLLVGAYSYAGPTFLLWNNGSAVFSLAGGALPQNAGGPPVVADYDGDGWPDVMALRRLFRNVGGSFVDVTATAIGSLAGYAVTDAADVDLDGDLDFVCNTTLLLNNAGVFTQVSSGLPLLGTPVAVDTDGDGDPDLLSRSSSAYLVNFLHQVDAPAAPVRGQTWNLQFAAVPAAGPAGSTVFLPALALVPVQVPVPGFGLLGIDLRQSVFLGGVIAGAAPGVLALPVPANPALAGQPVFCQAAVLPPNRPLRLSNTLGDAIR